ncbi:MAG TPA: hypothetical protein VFQ37_08150 [Mycobacterium sp.]|nr:hypothetical protein [Mycobacterium sp.]
MTTAERSRSHVLIAGVPWPVYKLVALVAALLVLLGVGVVTASAATAVLTAAATGTAVWLVLGPLHRLGG